MVALVMFPDTTELARTLLLGELVRRGVGDIAVGSQRPSPMPSRFIRCFTLPGRQTSRRTMWCQVIVHVYDPDELACSELARLCGAILRAAPDIVVDDDVEQWVTEPCEMTGPFPSQDPDLPDLARWQVNATWTIQSSVTE